MSELCKWRDLPIYRVGMASYFEGNIPSHINEIHLLGPNLSFQNASLVYPHSIAHAVYAYWLQTNQKRFRPLRTPKEFVLQESDKRQSVFFFLKRWVASKWAYLWAVEWKDTFLIRAYTWFSFKNTGIYTQLSLNLSQSTDDYMFQL